LLLIARFANVAALYNMLNPKYFITLLVGYLLVILDSAAQSNSIRNLGIEQGLSNNLVNCIAQDRQGFMWFGTNDGLNKYDGTSFYILRRKPADPASLIDNNIHTLATDNQDNLWIGTARGLSVLQLQTETFLIPTCHEPGQQAERKIGQTIMSAREVAGRVLIGTVDSGLIVFEQRSYNGTLIPLEGNGPDRYHYSVKSIAYDGQATWVFIESTGLALLDLARHRLTIVNRELKNGSSVEPDHQGHLWVGEESGIYQYHIATNHYSGTLIRPAKKVVSLHLDTAGLLWIGTDGGGLYKLVTGSIENGQPAVSYTHQELNSNSVFAVFEDKEARKWIGTLRGGISVIDDKPKVFKTIFDARAAMPESNFVLSLCENPDNTIWVGTDGGGLRLWDRTTNRFRDFLSGIPGSTISSNFITGILNDYEGKTWFSTWFGGVNRYDKLTGRFERYSVFDVKRKTVANNSWFIYEDRNRNLWASTGGLQRLNRTTNKFELLDSTLADVQCLSEDRQGQLWAGTYSSLVHIDPVHRRHHYFPIGYTVRAILADHKDGLWLGTDGGGLLHFDTHTGRFSQFTMADGLPNNSVLRILEDDKGMLWLSTFNGLAKFNPATNKASAYFQSDGLQSNQFSYNAAIRLRFGELVFGGLKGFTLFSPDSIRNTAAMPAVFLTGYSINNGPSGFSQIAKTEQGIPVIELGYDSAAIAVNFTAPEYVSPRKIKYAYFLSGWDKSWNSSGNSRMANYSNLREGTYVLLVKNTNADGVWGAEKTLLKIIVFPPWYRSWWAYALYGVLLILLSYLYLQYRNRQTRLRYELQIAHLNAANEKSRSEKEKVEKEKAVAEYQKEKAEHEMERVLNDKEKELNERRLSFFTNISHEFRTPLTLIINPVKELMEDKAGSHETGRDSLQIVYRNARRMLGLVDQLLLFRKAESHAGKMVVQELNFYELCREVYFCFVQQARSHSIRYEFIADNPDLLLFVDRSTIEIVLYNLLSNAFKYTPDGGAILFSIKETAEQVEISVEDTGQGIPAAVGDSIFEKFAQSTEPGMVLKPGFGIGLYMVKQFTDNHKGTVTYESIVGTGTAFYVHLQKGKVHFAAEQLVEAGLSGNGLLEEIAYRKEQETGTTENAGGDAGKMEDLVNEKKTILLVDDDPEMLRYITSLFREDFDIYTGGSGEEGLQQAKKMLPDIIVSDVKMSGISGIDFCKMVKENPATSHIPVILLTGTSSPELKLQGVEGGADDFITKPFEKELLVARVNTLLKNRTILQRYFFNEITLDKNNLKISPEYKEFLDACIVLVEQHLEDDDFNIKKMVAALGMSHSTLFRKVKSMSGLSVNEFIRLIRLRKAAEILINTDANINETALQVGLRNSKYFREQFNKVFGMNPSEYMKKFRKPFVDKFKVMKDPFDE
jgi:signal transduction histidine kinase/ligand-binding sensor domain-containing protein/DNA-binding response OmpR family regulator